jgi:hypothetical protein
MKSFWLKCFLLAFSAMMLSATTSNAQPTVGEGWGQINREVWYAHYWDQFTNRHYGGFNNAITWPGTWYNTGADPVERRQMANYKGFVIGATNVMDPQYPAVTWPYMVGQRDGRNDGEKGEALPALAPDPITPNQDTQILFKGRLDRLTYRQAYPVVTTDGAVNGNLKTNIADNQTVEIVGDEDDGAYQSDVIDPTLIADVTLDTHSWSRMGVSTSRRVYAYVDRDNDDYMFWHWRMINDGLWGRLGVDKVDCCGGTHGTATDVMMGMMFQWGRSSAGANRTAGAGEANNDTIWRYYGVDYDAASPTEDMRLAYIIDGDQDPSKYNPAHGKQNDIGDPDPTTGDLLDAKAAGWQILHYDVSTTDRNDDVAQPLTIGWQNYALLLQTGNEGHETKYNQMALGLQQVGDYYPGDHFNTPGRGAHPEAGSGASWIKASNDPATSTPIWPGKVLGLDIEVTDVEQQAGFGPDDIPAGDTLNAVFAVGVKGLDEPYAIEVGRSWLAGDIDDAAKDALVNSSIDSLFNTMRQAKAVYESADFGGRSASTRPEFEAALAAAITAGDLSLSPPAPATFDVTSGPGKIDMAWTLNTTTGSAIAGWRVYRALASFKGDSAFAMVADLAPGVLSYADSDVEVGFSYYYYLTTYDAAGHESTMHTRTSDPAIPLVDTAVRGGSPIRFELSQNAPNPFNPSTTIRLALSEAGQTRLDIYGVNGQLVRTLIDGTMSVGSHEIIWDGTDAVGNKLGSGTYIYRLVNGENVSVRRMVLVR